MDSLNSISKYVMRLRVKRAIDDLKELEPYLIKRKQWECTPIVLLAITKLVKPVANYLPEAELLKDTGFVLDTSFNDVGSMLDWLDKCIDYTTPDEEGNCQEIPKNHIMAVKKITETGVYNVFYSNYYYISPTESVSELETRLTTLVAQLNNLPNSKVSYYNLRFKEGLSQIFAFLESLIRILQYVETTGIIRTIGRRQPGSKRGFISSIWRDHTRTRP